MTPKDWADWWRLIEMARVEYDGDYRRMARDMGRADKPLHATAAFGHLMSLARIVIGEMDPGDVVLRSIIREDN